MERTLDWRPKWDERSARWTFGSASTPCTSLAAHGSVMRLKSVWLDQGQEGACTGFGEEHVRALSPYAQPTSNRLAQQVYEQARREDEWEGEDYEGSSVNGAMRAARTLGLISKWYWARTTTQARHGLSYHAAGQLGVNWYTGCFYTDEQGFISLDGQVEGGHSLALAGYVRRPERTEVAFRLENSWGPSWGDRGGCWIWESDLARLLAENGELAFPSKVRG